MTKIFRTETIIMKRKNQEPRMIIDRVQGLKERNRGWKFQNSKSSSPKIQSLAKRHLNDHKPKDNPLSNTNKLSNRA